MEENKLSQTLTKDEWDELERYGINNEIALKNDIVEKIVATYKKAKDTTEP